MQAQKEPLDLDNRYTRTFLNDPVEVYMQSVAGVHEAGVVVNYANMNWPSCSRLQFFKFFLVWFVRAVVLSEKGVMLSDYDVHHADYSSTPENVDYALDVLDSMDSWTYATKYEDYLFRWVMVVSPHAHVFSK
jgi:hypothetical protein